MRLGDRLRHERDLMGKAWPGWEAVTARLADSPVTISGSNLNRWALEPTPEQVGHHPEAKPTPWGTVSTIDRARNPHQLVAVCRIFGWTQRSAWLSVGESLGLLEMDLGAPDEMHDMLSSGALTLNGQRRSMLREYSQLLVQAQQAEERASRAEARAAQLEAELAAARAASTASNGR